MRRLLTLLFLLSPILGARADYSDPWGLPSGTVTLKLARQDSIQAGAPVHAFDFSMNHVDSLLAYDVLVAAGRADLLLWSCTRARASTGCGDRRIPSTNWIER